MLAFRVPQEVPPPPAPSAEDEIRSALAHGDRRAALEVLMRAYGDAVYRFCRRQLGDDSLAQDVLQQSFAEAWEDLPRFAQRSSPRTWLFGIVAHRCQDAARRRRRFTARFKVGEVLEDQGDPAERADERLERGAVERALRACLEALAPASRMAVGLRFVEGFGYREMAEICVEKAGTLQRRVARALPQLKDCMTRRGIRG